MLLQRSVHPAARRLANLYFGAPPIVAATLVGVTVTAAVWPSLHAHPVFPDVVAGYLSMFNGDKSAEPRGTLVFVGLVVALSAFAGWALRRAPPDGPASGVGRALNQLVLLSLAPAAWRLAVALASPGDGLPPLGLPAVWPALALLAAVLLGGFAAGSVRPADVLSCGGSVVLAVPFASLAMLGVLTALARLMPSGRVAGFVAAHTGLFVALAAAGSLAAVVTVRVRSSDIDQLRGRLLRAIAALQLPIPLLLFHLVPPPLVDGTHLLKVAYPLALVLVLTGCVAVGIATAAWRMRQPARTLRRAVAPAAVIAVFVFCRCPTVGPPAADLDLFHFGEQVLPWQQWWTFNRRPYVDFVPVHGLMSYLRGAMGQGFFDGTAASFASADALLRGLVLAATAGAACWLLGTVPALVLLATPLVTPELTGQDRIFLLPPALFLAASPRLWRRPVPGLLGWVAICATVVWYNAALGPGFVVATAPLAAVAAWRAGRRASLSVALGVATVVAITALAVPGMGEMAVGYYRFVVDNGWTYDVAHGIPWPLPLSVADLNANGIHNRLLWETIRVGWVGAAVVAAGLAWRATAVDHRRRATVVGLAVATVVVVAASFPWAMGRVDPLDTTRSSAVTVLAAGYLLPALLLLFARPARAAVAVLVAVVVAGLLQTNPRPDLDPAELAAKAGATRAVPDTATVDDGGKLGLPGLGQVVASSPDDPMPDMAELHRVLQRLLRPGETYLSLSNDTALYYYMGLPIPVRYATFVAANVRLQAGEEQQLAAHPPPVVLIGPSAMFNLVPDALRCYRLWRTYALTYVPVRLNRYTLLVDPVRVAEFQGVPPPPAGARPPVTEDQLTVLDQLERPATLAYCAMTWGRSWATLRQRFTVVATGDVAKEPTEKDPWALASIPVDRVPDGAAADFVLLHLSGVQTDQPDPHTSEPVPAQMVLQWTTGAGDRVSNDVPFFAGNGDLLVPLGAYPRWLLGEGVGALGMGITNQSPSHPWHLDSVTYLRLNPT